MRAALSLLAGSLLVLACGPDQHGAPPARRPNIVFILADDLGWADVGYQGSTFHPTPNIDALAREGMVFSDAYASSPVCSPTRFSFLTGQSPARHGMTKALNPDVLGGTPGPPTTGPPDAEWWEPVLLDHVPLETTTVAERLKEAGYRTGVIGKWHLGEPLPESHGFDVALATAPLGGPSRYFAPYGIRGFPEGPGGEYITDRLTFEAIRFIEDSKEEPFFLFLSHFAPHSPWEAKPEYVARHQARVDPEAEQKNPIYAAMIESLDESVGAIVAALERLGLTEETLLVFTSDNGALTQRWLRRKSRHRTLFEITSNAPLRGGKGKLYEGGLRVPMVVRWPGVIAAGGRCEIPVDTTDYYPTFLRMAGLQPAGEPLDGVDLYPLFRGGEKLERDALYFHFPHQTLACAMRRGNDKLVHYFSGETELYDLASDLGEEHDLSEERPEKARELRQELFSWLEEVGAVLPVRGR